MKSARLAFIAILSLPLAACGGGDAGDEETVAGDTVEEVSTVEPSSSETTVASATSSEPAAFMQCKACHSVKPGQNGIGPSLAGIMGTKAGEVEGFTFSPAMIASGLTWDEATLDAYIANPRGVVPGTKMSYAGMKDEAKRKEVIEYIKTLK